MPITIQPLGLTSSSYDQYPAQLEIAVLDVGTQSLSQVYGAAAITDAQTYSERLQKLFKRSFTQATQNFIERPGQLLILIQLPLKKSARYKYSNENLITGMIKDFGAPWDKINIRFIDSVDVLNVANQLFIEQSELTGIIIGAIDSVFEPDTIAHLDKQNELWTTNQGDGTALGEAAGWLLLTRDASKAPLFLKNYTTAQDKYALVTVVEQLQLEQRINVFVKLFSNNTHNVNQQHEINLRFLDAQVRVVELAAHCGYVGCASSVIALDYLANDAELKQTPWNTALIVHHDLDSNSAHSYLITQGNIYDQLSH